MTLKFAGHIAWSPVYAERSFAIICLVNQTIIIMSHHDLNRDDGDQTGVSKSWDVNAIRLRIVFI